MLGVAVGRGGWVEGGLLGGGTIEAMSRESDWGAGEAGGGLLSELGAGGKGWDEGVEAEGRGLDGPLALTVGGSVMQAA